MNENNIREVVECIIEAMDELKSEEPLTDYDKGQLLAYAESLCIIRDACAGYDLKAIGLDFDIDERFLIESP